MPHIGINAALPSSGYANVRFGIDAHLHPPAPGDGWRVGDEYRAEYLHLKDLEKRINELESGWSISRIVSGARRHLLILRFLPPKPTSEESAQPAKAAKAAKAAEVARPVATKAPTLNGYVIFADGQNSLAVKGADGLRVEDGGLIFVSEGADASTPIPIERIARIDWDAGQPRSYEPWLDAERRRFSELLGKLNQDIRKIANLLGRSTHEVDQQRRYVNRTGGVRPPVRATGATEAKAD